jgi:hypothetical protein
LVPTGLAATLTGLNQITLSWQPSPGASSYLVQTSFDGIVWSAVGGPVTSTFLIQSSLDYSTTYEYRVMASSSAGSSPASSVVAATTLAQPDVLSARSLIIKVTRRSPFTVPVAGFTDANTAATAASFIAKIKWGDGKSSLAKISGGDGTFVVTGTHVYARTGVYKIQVTVTMARPGISGASAKSAALVRNPVKRKPRPLPIPSHVRKIHKAAAHRIR